MLTQLAIHRIGVIDEAVLDFGPGFTSLTGETGAGKTMVVTGLSLLMGRRLDSRRAGVSSMVEGRVRADGSVRLSEKIDDLGAESDDGEVLIVRRVTKDGRSRAHVGGVPVPVSTLANVVGSDITIHGQSDQLRLKDPDQQREALDNVLSDETRAIAESHASLFNERSSAAREARSLEAQLQDRDSRRASLTALLEQIEQANTYEGEDDALRKEIEELTRAAEEQEALDTTLMALVGDERASLLAAADVAVDAIGKLPGAETEATADLVTRIHAVRDDVSGIARDISARRDDAIASPGRLEEAQERLHELSTLIRDVGPHVGGAATVTELLAQSQKALAALEALDDGAQRLEDLTARIKECDRELSETSTALTRARTLAAEDLASTIDTELTGLEMPGAHVRISVTEAPMQVHGADAVLFELQPHPGADFMPLSTGASGGELSRVMLALEVAIARLGALTAGGVHPVFIFDEIDAGIGGRAARAVGERLAELAQTAQVIVVTHLPQVAAFAETHLQIVKSVSDRGETRSTVQPLTGEERVKELARMLAGDDDSATALEHARELLAGARQSEGGAA